MSIFLYPHWQKCAASAPKSPGLYVIYADKELLYIGKAENLYNRLKNHNLRDQCTKLGMTHIATMVIEDPWHRHVCESYLIKQHKSRLNSRYLLRVSGMSCR